MGGQLSTQPCLQGRTFLGWAALRLVGWEGEARDLVHRPLQLWCNLRHLHRDLLIPPLLLLLRSGQAAPAQEAMQDAHGASSQSDWQRYGYRDD